VAGCERARGADLGEGLEGVGHAERRTGACAAGDRLMRGGRGASRNPRTASARLLLLAERLTAERLGDSCVSGRFNARLAGPCWPTRQIASAGYLQSPERPGAA
jgi:hypothetical protein